MKRTYSVLLDASVGSISRQQAAGLLFESPLELAARLMGDPPRPTIHRERLTTQELAELMREPNFVAAAEVMRTRLIAPLSEEEPAENVGWGLRAVGADSCFCSGKGVTVALLDTGIDARHAAFRGVQISEKDFTGTGLDDTVGHGTHSAGIFFGRDVGGKRIGVARGVPRAFIGKILGTEGGNTFMMLRGILWAFEEARIIMLAAGFDFASTVADRVAEGWPEYLATAVSVEAMGANLRLLDRLLSMLRLHEPFSGGALVMAGAGDDSRRNGSAGFTVGSSLAAEGKVLTVGAFDVDSAGRGYRMTERSNAEPALCGPGRGIVSAVPGGGLGALSGTNGACAHAAGVAALWWEAIERGDSPATATAVRQRLLATAQTKGFAPSALEVDRGAGRVRAPSDSVSNAENFNGRDATLSMGSPWSGGRPSGLTSRVKSNMSNAL